MYRAGILIIVGICLLVAGCGSGDPCAVSGEVSFGGVPVKDGNLRFFPVHGTPGRGASAPIRQGKYAILQDQGLMAGSYRVSITATHSTGRKIRNAEPMPGEDLMVDEVVQYIPEAYNARTTLRVELEPDDNRQDFLLEKDARE